MYIKTGKLISKDITTGTSKAGKMWSKIDFIIDLTTDPKWPNRVKFESFKGDVLEMVQDTSEGTNIQVEFDVDSRDWTNPQGKTIWFTSCKATGVQVVRANEPIQTDGNHAGVQQMAQMHNQQYQRATTVVGDDPSSDLPF